MILDRIVEATAGRVAGMADFPQNTSPGPGQKSLRGAITGKRSRNAVIAEIKGASPSRGTIRPVDDPAALARDLVTAGACALSVITEPHFFGGNTEYILSIRPHVDVPILRKDFIIDERQIRETSALGADAVLLIARVLKESLGEFVDSARRTGLEPLVEVHSRDEVRTALDTGAEIIGINNRDLHTLKIDLSTTMRLAPLLRDAGRTVISESGILWPCDIRTLRSGVDGFLVGSAIMGSRDPARRLEGLVFA